MDYILSFIYPSSTDNTTNIVVDKCNKKVKDVYSEQCEVINKFLETRDKSILNKPGGGGEHNPNDKRVKRLVNDAMSLRVYNDFIDDVSVNLPVILKNEIKKQHILTNNTAKKRLVNYLYDK